MLADFQVFLLVLVLAQAGFWLLPPEAAAWRGRWLLLVSFFLLVAVSPLSLAGTSLMTLACSMAVGLGRSAGAGARRIIFVAVLGGMVTLVTLAGLVGGGMSTVGLSYVLLRLVIVLREELLETQREPLSLETLLLALLFFPLYSAGPVQPPRTFVDATLGCAFSLAGYLQGVGRIVIGVFKIYFLAGLLLNGWIDAIRASEISGVDERGAAWAVVYLGFAFLYCNFSGYTDIAVGAGRTLGIPLLENFRWPFLAASIQEFWQRWHLSLAAFIRTHMFVPFARLLRGRVGLATVLSFVLAGLWHHLSLPYLLWGLCHGAALVGYSRYARWAGNQPWLRGVRRSLPWRVAGIGATVTLVAVLSAFANTPSLDESMALLRRLW